MNRETVILQHMLEDINDIKTFIRGLDYEAFENNVLVRKAVCMSLINIGELSKALPKDFRDENGQIPWKNIAGLRDLAAHKYHTLMTDIIWKVATTDIVALNMFVRNYLETN